MFLRRTVHRLSEEPLEYLVEKATPGREVLSVRVYMPAEAEERVVIRARTEIPAAARRSDPDSWTFAETRFEVRHRDGQVVRVFASDARPLRAGYRFSIVLGSDLEVGEYRISLRREAGPVCFVYMAKMMLRTGDERSVFVERERPVEKRPVKKRPK